MPHLPSHFTNKTVFLTGAATGIGRATALAFAREGARVAVCDIADDAAYQTVELVSTAGGTATFIHTDVASYASIEAAVRQTLKEFGSVDIAINNAGIEGTRTKAIHEYDESEFRRVIDVNLTGVFLSMKAELALAMLPASTQAKADGKPFTAAIVNIASFLGHFAMPLHSAYIATKHGVMGLTKAAALEYARAGVRVNAVCPGWIDTPMTAAHDEKDAELMKRYLAATPFRRMGQPEEIAETILFLASDAASYITGQGYIADGGMSAM
jgi:NAD(P)-dependent dehydrogenase (short-subunit alcohol dehydrogenase family)